MDPVRRERKSLQLGTGRARACPVASENEDGTSERSQLPADEPRRIRLPAAASRTCVVDNDGGATTDNGKLPAATRRPKRSPAPSQSMRLSAKSHRRNRLSQPIPAAATRSARRRPEATRRSRPRRRRQWRWFPVARTREEEEERQDHTPQDLRRTKPSRPADGDRSLTRALGLKIGRIVVDAGHGGHDTGTIGPMG